MAGGQTRLWHVVTSQPVGAPCGGTPWGWGVVRQGQAWFGRRASNVGAAAAAAALILVAVALVPIAGAAAAQATPVQPVPSRVYVANRSSNTVSVIDPATNAVVTTVAVGTQPTAVAVSPDGTRVYVANSGSNSVSVIDAATATVVATVAVGTQPVALAVSPDGTRAYVTDNGLSVLDLTTNTVVATVDVTPPSQLGYRPAAPVGVAVSPDGTRAYVVSPERLAPVNPRGSIYVPGVLAVVDTATNTVVTVITLPFALSGVTVTPDGTQVYVTANAGLLQGQFGPSQVIVVDTATNQIADKILLGGNLTSVAAAPDGRRTYVTNSGSGTVSVIDPVTATVAATVAVGSGPQGVTVSPDSKRAYVTNFGSGTVSVIDTTTDVVVATVAVGAGPTGVAVGPAATNPPTCPPSRVGAGPRGPFTNVLDADTSTIDHSVGRWVPWYSTTISQSAAPPHGCSHSLKVDITAPNGWGVTLGNFPGFTASPGAHVIGFWGRSAAATFGLAATMTVTWRNAARVVLGTDAVTLPLTGRLSHASTLAFAPAGTAFANVDFTNSSGRTGDVVYLDDIVVTPVPSALDADTSTLEGGRGQWAPWYSTKVSQSTDQAHGGRHSLKVDVTAPNGWGVILGNFPGGATTPGAHVLGFWGRSATPGEAATMTVTWRDGARAALGTDTVALALTDTWSQANVLAFAPPGTAFADVRFSNASGQPGDTVYLDDISVISVPSALDADTSTLEGGRGQWAPWYSTKVSQSTDQAHGGTHSLKVDITASNGWGVTLGNFPGFATTPGPKTIGFWGRSPSLGLSATMTVRWRDASGAPLATNQLTLALGDSWAQAVANVIAPPGTARVTVEFSDRAGTPGATLFLDDIGVVDATVAALAPSQP